MRRLKERQSRGSWVRKGQRNRRQGGWGGWRRGRGGGERGRPQEDVVIKHASKPKRLQKTKPGIQITQTIKYKGTREEQTEESVLMPVCKFCLCVALKEKRAHQDRKRNQSTKKELCASKIARRSKKITTKHPPPCHTKTILTNGNVQQTQFRQNGWPA